MRTTSIASLSSRRMGVVLKALKILRVGKRGARGCRTRAFARMDRRRRGSILRRMRVGGEAEERGVLDFSKEGS